MDLEGYIDTIQIVSEHGQDNAIPQHESTEVEHEKSKCPSWLYIQEVRRALIVDMATKKPRQIKYINQW